jgi:ketosteroid isomerase-like protein
MSAAQNKALVAKIFEELAAGNHRALLNRVSEKSRWTVTGTCPISGRYVSRQEFYDKVLARVTGHLSGRVFPRVVDIISDGDKVVVQWTGESTSRLGKPYNNEYCWVLKIAKGMIEEGTIYSDTELVTALLGG